jgi:CRISPR-associated endoribonuclease Cas6/Csy4 subtype I-F
MDKNTHYTDVRILADPIPVIMGHLVARIHGFSAKNTEEFNLALPKLKTGNRPMLGNVLRIFGAQDSLNALLDDLDNTQRETYLTTRVKVTPDSQTFVAYVRMRLPARSSINVKRQAHSAIDQRNRFSRLENYKSMPYFSVKSKSSNQMFPVVIAKQKKGVKSCASALTGNGYGFSTATKLVWLPDFV